MKNVILQEFLTLDGLAAGRNDRVDFVPGRREGVRRQVERDAESRQHDDLGDRLAGAIAINEELIDEYRLVFCPVVYGGMVVPKAHHHDGPTDRDREVLRPRARQTSRVVRRTVLR